MHFILTVILNENFYCISDSQLKKKIRQASLSCRNNANDPQKQLNTLYVKIFSIKPIRIFDGASSATDHNLTAANKQRKTDFGNYEQFKKIKIKNSLHEVKQMALRMQIMWTTSNKTAGQTDSMQYAPLRWQPQDKQDKCIFDHKKVTEVVYNTIYKTQYILQHSKVGRRRTVRTHFV